MSAGIVERISSKVGTISSIAKFSRLPEAKQHGISMRQMLSLAMKIRKASRVPECASTFAEQLVLAREVIRIPRSETGDVAEFGCFKGLSTASLSLACKLVGRRLIVFDSFEGLPENEDNITQISTGMPVVYEKGELLAGLEEVKKNVETYGEISVCEFVKGYFDDTLPHRADDSYSLIFEDADLPSSVRTVLIHAWPKLMQGGKFFCHESRDLEVVSIFFDESFWSENLRQSAPGVVGSGTGLALDRDNHSTVVEWGSCLCYTEKRMHTAEC